MTITTTSTVEKYVGDGSQNAWPITFPFFDSGDIKACIVTSSGEQVDLTYGTDYTVSVSTGSIGGTLNYTLANNQELTIWLSLPLTQSTDFYNTGPLNAETLEDGFDRLTLIAQQLQEESDRAIKVSTSSDETPEELLASLYTAHTEAVSSASSAAVSESNAAASGQAAAASESNAATSESAAASSAITAQAWAESETAPDPNDAESKSAKSWALAASDSVPIASSTYAGKVMASASLNVDQTTGVATVPTATEALAGIARRATDDEVATGEEDGAVFVTPSHLGVLDTKINNTETRIRDDLADINLSNVSATGKAAAFVWSAPDWDNAVVLSSATAFSYTFTTQGYLTGFLYANTSGVATITINDVLVCQLYTGSTSLCIPVVPGDIMQLSGSIGTLQSTGMQFVPLKGAINVEEN